MKIDVGPIVLKFQPPSPEDYVRFRADCGWGTVSPQAAERALQSSLLDVSCWHGDELVGFGRVVGDGVLYFYLQDIIVHSNWRRQAIGRKIVRTLLKELKKEASIGATVGLMAAEGKEAFYEQFGLTARPSAGLGAGMTQVLFDAV